MISSRLRRNLSARDPRLILDLPLIFGKEIVEDRLRDQIGQRVIDKIVDRTENSNFLQTRRSNRNRRAADRRFNSATLYTPEYVNSFEFRVFFKRQGQVNLTASGDMLGSIDIIDSRPDRMTIGFADQLEANKAHGHITGSVGKQRDFFGLPESEIINLRREFRQEVSESGRIFGQDDQRLPGESNLDFLIRVLGIG